ncbi:hypothetical protein NEOLEDRAFT_1147577 [Neolentinus lepideus HHB14362 ss-1]|uniref:Uncharacterized protein n=1 Tax=Neolentinus lepideus HHB14362 ss-1 TaxID=1314782 RepID=A0A165SX96_9AGAM|nr:hypothetical protein NEOLEDRAFT_1147577 [Neolentinus lepideus HHB14362 ss-1]
MHRLRGLETRMQFEWPASMVRQAERTASVVEKLKCARSEVKQFECTASEAKQLEYAPVQRSRNYSSAPGSSSEGKKFECTASEVEHSNAAVHRLSRSSTHLFKVQQLKRTASEHIASEVEQAEVPVERSEVERTALVVNRTQCHPVSRMSDRGHLDTSDGIVLTSDRIVVTSLTNTVRQAL